MYQSGFPDLFCAHVTWGIRWVEVKRPVGYRFTAAQLHWFPLFMSAGVGVWVLTSERDSEILKLKGPANWTAYLDVMK